jgi:hypothetical protein
MCILGRCVWRCCGHVESIHDPDCDDPNCTVVINADIPDVSQSVAESQQYCPVHGHMLRDVRRSQGYHYRNQQARQEKTGQRRMENAAIENANTLVQSGFRPATSNTPKSTSIFPDWVASVSHSALNRFAAPLPPNYEEQLREGSIQELHNVRPSIPHPDGLVYRASSAQQQGSPSREQGGQIQDSPSQRHGSPMNQPVPYGSQQPNHPGYLHGGRGQPMATSSQGQPHTPFGGNVQDQVQARFGPNTQGAQAPIQPGKPQHLNMTIDQTDNLSYRYGTGYSRWSRSRSWSS